MKLILPFDTETTGIPSWKIPSDDDEQPHLVQLAAILCRDDDAKVLGELDVIIKPDGWIIPDEAADIHGITTEQAMDEGIPEADALERFVELYRQCDLRIAHNTTFDNRIIRIALKRHFPDLIPDDEWKNNAAYYCTLVNSRKIMGGKSGHTLAEAYLHFTGKELAGGHNAMVDTNACLEIYQAIINQKD